MYIFTYIKRKHPMGKSLSIDHRLDVEIPRGKFVETTSILKDESLRKL